MATVRQSFAANALYFPAASNAAPHVVDGTNFPIPSIAFDADGDKEAYLDFRAVNYGFGNLTVDIDWYADTASSGDIVLGAAIGAITPNTDSQDIEADALATENTVTDSHLGTTNKRLHRATITVSNLDSLAADDDVVMRIRRIGSSGSDTMAGDALVTKVTVSYSDT